MKMNEMYGQKIAVHMGRSSETTGDILEDIENTIKDSGVNGEYRRLFHIRLIELMNATRHELKEEMINMFNYL